MTRCSRFSRKLGPARFDVARRAVFLDRDGVLNAAVVRDGVPHPPRSVDEVEILPGVYDACNRLRAAGFELVVVTNQPDIARGTQTREAVRRINDALLAALPLDEVVICPHDDADGCDCRKPRPGMLVAAAQRRGIDLSASFLVGDRWRDIEAGIRAGCRTLLIDRDYDERSVRADVSVIDLGKAVVWILDHDERTSAGE
jgi:D-glycero-D-manno-heptose 1,7-bisphosphate phosphatase